MWASIERQTLRRCRGERRCRVGWLRTSSRFGAGSTSGAARPSSPGRSRPDLPRSWSSTGLRCSRSLEGGRYVAVVDSDGHEPALIAEVDTAAGIIRVRSLKAETPQGKSLELWHVEEGKQPRSLGILQAGLDAQTIKEHGRAGQRPDRGFGRARGRLAIGSADRADRLYGAADPGRVTPDACARAASAGKRQCATSRAHA